MIISSIIKGRCNIKIHDFVSVCSLTTRATLLELTMQVLWTQAFDSPSPPPPKSCCSHLYSLCRLMPRDLRISSALGKVTLCLVFMPGGGKFLSLALKELIHI